MLPSPAVRLAPLSLHPLLFAAAAAWLASTACGKPAARSEAAPTDRVRCSTHVVPDAPTGGTLSKAGLSNLLTFTVASFDPYPAQTGLNTWKLAITDQAGAPVVGATFGKVVPTMPDHGHNSPTVPTLEADGTRYTLGRLNFFMPGLWQVSITATSPQNVTDTVVVDLCVGTD